MKRSTFFALFIALLLLSETFYLSLYSGLNHTIILYSAVSIINSVLFLLIWILLKNQKDISLKPVLAVIFSAGIIFRLSLLAVPPTASDDINRYVWDGKVMANGVNPYRYAPDAPELSYLHSDQLPKHVNFPSMKTIYPPFAQLVFFTSYKLFGENFTGFKFILFFFEVLTMFLLYLLLKELKIPLFYVSLYALCPLPVMQFMIDGHVDSIGLPVLLLSLLLFFKGKRLGFLFFSGLSISTKLISGMILPFTIDKLEKNYFKKILLVILPLLVFALSYLPFVTAGVFPFESLGQFTTNWAFNGSAFTVFFNMLPDNQKARLISALLFILYGIYLFISKKEITEKIVLIFFMFLLLSPTVHPWYLTWLAILLPLSFRWSGFAFVTLVNLANFVVINYTLKGIWQVDNSMLWIEYLPVYSLFVLEVIKSFRKTGKDNVSVSGQREKLSV